MDIQDSEDQERFVCEVDQVYDMLDRLTSKDSKISTEAQRDIDLYLAEKAAKSIQVTTDRTVINRSGSEDMAKAKKRSLEAKEMGNAAFQQKNYKRAMELYTSAILLDDQNAVLFTNRAQAYIQLEKYDEAIEDCKLAMKLKPDSVKSYIHMARALKSKEQFSEAVEVLDKAETICAQHLATIHKYKADLIQSHKAHFLQHKEN